MEFSRILLIRHATTDRVGKALSGWLPGIPLDDAGQAQALALVERVAGVKIDAIYSSPIQRAMETARPLSLSRDIEISEWARKFFDNWTASLKWQRLKPYEKFARMIDKHWEGIASYCNPENKVPLGFVEGMNNKIRVLQRRAYGIRDEEYLRLKIITCMLPEI